MTTITHAQARALEVITQELDKVAPGRGKDYMDVILGVLNVEMPMKVEYEIYTGIGDDTPVAHNEPVVISTPDIYQPIGNEDLQTHTTGDPIYPHTPFPQKVWYNQEPEPIQTDARDDVRYVTEVSCTGNKNCITTTYAPAVVQYTGDFRDVQTSFNDK